VCASGPARGWAGNGRLTADPGQIPATLAFHFDCDGLEALHRLAVVVVEVTRREATLQQRFSLGHLHPMLDPLG
jgi:hypothetical protein